MRVLVVLALIVAVFGCSRSSEQTPSAHDTTAVSEPAPRQASTELPLPYRNAGACPFECCAYKAWTANTEVTLYADVESPAVVVTVAPGDSVLGLTGVVITTTPGHVRVLRPFVIGERETTTVVPGDSVYVLHPLGEGASMLWVRGKAYAGPMEERDAPFEVVDRPVTTWWVKVRDRQGREGWTAENQAFDHKDSCE